MRYLLDSDFIIDILRGSSRAIEVLANLHGELYIATVSLGEVMVGIVYKNAVRQQKILSKILENISLINFNQDHAIRYGEIRAELQKRGKYLGDPDVQIAVTALVENLTLVTANEDHFSRIKGIKLLNYREVKL